MAPTQREIFNVAYSSQSPAHKLDVYLPRRLGPHPVIVFVHGGGYVAGDKRDGQEQPVLTALERGYAVVSINYRLLEEVRFPAQVHDVKAAVRWVRAHADTYGFDSDRIALWGSSAGGHLAVLAANTDTPRFDDLSLGNGSQSSRVRAVVDWFGPVDFAEMHEYLQAQGEDATATQTVGIRYLSEMLESSPELVNEADPTTHISSSDPPVFIQHGDADTTVPVWHSEKLASAILDRFGSQKAKVSILSGAGHGGSEFFSRNNVNLIVNFLDDSLGR